MISELMQAQPAQAMLDWFGQHRAADLFISVVTEAELCAGVAYLPEGQGRDRLQLGFDAMIDEDFHGRIVPFDTVAARPYADIAAIARVKDAPLVTRNVKDFDGCGIRAINPWNDQ